MHKDATHLKYIQDNLNEVSRPGMVDVSIRYLPGLYTGGIERALGSEIVVFDEWSWTPEQDLPDDMLFDIRLDYGDVIRPVVLKPAAEMPFIIDLGYTYNRTRIGLSWFRMEGSDELSGRVRGLDVSNGAAASEFGYGFVSFWNMGYDLHASRGFPAQWFEGSRDLDENEDSDYEGSYNPDRGRTDWKASAGSSLNSFRLTLRHPLVDNDNIVFQLEGGLLYGRWEDNLMQSVNMTAHTELTDRWTQMLYDEVAGDSVSVTVYLDYIFHNDITLETNSSVTFNSLGATAGLSGDWRLSPSLMFSIQAGIGLLSGDATFKGSGIDIDDITEQDILTVYDDAGNLVFRDPLEGVEFLSGNFDLPEYTGTVISTNYNMHLGITYEIYENISLKAGYFLSLWRNLPLSPQWSYSDSYTQPFDAFALEESWNKNIKGNLSNSGFSVGIGLAF